MDVVRLDRVNALPAQVRGASGNAAFGALRARLRDVPRIESPSVVVLQELVRERTLA